MNATPACQTDSIGEPTATGAGPGTAATTRAKVVLEAPRFIDSPPLEIVGMTRSYRGDNRGIPAQWEGFLPRMKEIERQRGQVAYGVCYAGGREGFEYLCGVEVEGGAEVPEGMARVSLPGQRYAVFPHRGHVSALAQTVHAVFEQWIPTSGYRAGTHPDLFERYAEDFDAWTGLGGMEVWVPVQREGNFNSNQETNMSSEEQQIHTLIEDWLKAANNKDLNGVMAHRSPEMLAFDVMPPTRFLGAEDYRQHWANCFQHFTGEFTFTIEEVKVTVGTDMALGTFLLNCQMPAVTENTGGPSRCTFVLRKVDGQWTVIHEHHSMPMECPAGDAGKETTEAEAATPGS